MPTLPLHPLTHHNKGPTRLFASQIIFPEAHWVGTKEENPTEMELPMPAELQSTVKHEKYVFGSDANQTGETHVQSAVHCPSSKWWPMSCHHSLI